jgi:hypothetical protein
MAKATRRAGTRLTTQGLMVAILLIAIFAVAVRQPAETDTWRNLKSGRLLWESRQVPRSDSFSHTVAGQPWINHGWFVQLLIWLVHGTLGLAGQSLVGVFGCMGLLAVRHTALFTVTAALNGRVLDDYVHVHWIHPGSPQALADYDNGHIITERTGLLDSALQGLEGWERVYEDDMATIYVHSEGMP